MNTFRRPTTKVNTHNMNTFRRPTTKVNTHTIWIPLEDQLLKGIWHNNMNTLEEWDERKMKNCPADEMRPVSFIERNIPNLREGGRCTASDAGEQLNDQSFYIFNAPGGVTRCFPNINLWYKVAAPSRLKSFSCHHLLGHLGGSWLNLSPTKIFNCVPPSQSILL